MDFPPSITTDWPKEVSPPNPVALRRWGKTFYSPSYFHLSPTHNRILPLAIRDVTSARNLLEVYGVLALEKHNQGYILINNYPVSTVQIFGRVMWYSYKNFDRGPQKNPYNFVLFLLDDCSGENLSILVKISESQLRIPLRHFTEDLLVEITGTVSHVLDYEKQVIGKSLQVLGNYDDTEVEMQCWRRILTTRELLRHQWKCVPNRPIVIDSDDLMELERADYERELRSGPPDSPTPPLLKDDSEIPSSPVSSLVYYTASDHVHPSSDHSREILPQSSEPNSNQGRKSPLPRLHHKSPCQMDAPVSISPICKRVTVPVLVRDSQNHPYRPTMKIIEFSDSDGSMSDPIVSDSSHPTRNLLVIIIDE